MLRRVFLGCTVAKKESQLQSEIQSYLRSRGWLSYVTTANALMSGIPDLILFRSDVGVRFADVKRPVGGTLTKRQVQVWSDWESHGLGVWVITECDESVLLEPHNWRQWWQPRYEKFLLKPPSQILRELDRDIPD